ncbi:hypothetical protein HYT24_00440 [Candidatus Pacearchaeota archaeon]|nr:hypothetical protein [Candidatus Pacearchaeota archaeon]
MKNKNQEPRMGKEGDRKDKPKDDDDMDDMTMVEDEDENLEERKKRMESPEAQL